jgi:hypothetical protein
MYFLKSWRGQNLKKMLFHDFWAWYTRKNDIKNKYKSKLNSWDNVDLKYTPSDNYIFNIRKYYPNFD